MDDQGMPSTRCARRRVSAITAASWMALEATRIRTDPGSALASGSRSRRPRPACSERGRPGDGPTGNRVATRREAASSTGPLRRQVRSAMTLARWSSGVLNRSGKRPIACTSAPRNA